MRNYISAFIISAHVGTSYGFQPASSASSILNRPTSNNISKQPVAPIDLHNHQPISSVVLKASTSSSSSSSTTGNNEVLDIEAITKYGSAAVIQLSLISGFFFGLDQILALTNLSLPTPATWFLCYAFSLKSRTFNPLNNARPDREKAVSEEGSAGFKDRIQPSWTPPGVVFPIMWILIISPLRATSSTMIINSLGGEYFTLPLMCLMLHLTCGDIWNTINNTEKRFGTSVLGISCVYVSALFAAFQYFQVDPLAGKLLGATAIWLTIASSLIIQTWRLNVNDDGEKDSLLPMKVDGEESKTQFSWF